MRFDLDNNFKLSKFSVSNSNLVIKGGNLHSLSKLRELNPGVADVEKPNCFKDKSYYECLQCVLPDHCGHDLA